MRSKRKLILTLLCFTGITVSAQSYSLRTNVLGLATTNLNVEASMTLSRKWSVHLPVQYNPFKFANNRQFRNIGCYKATSEGSLASMELQEHIVLGIFSEINIDTKEKVMVYQYQLAKPTN